MVKFAIIVIVQAAKYLHANKSVCVSRQGGRMEEK